MLLRRPYGRHAVLLRGVRRWTTHDAVLMAKFEAHGVHGGPPVVLVPAQQSFTGKAYYLGVMHHIERLVVTPWTVSDGQCSILRACPGPNAVLQV